VATGWPSPWGIVILAAVSIAMLWTFDASVDALIPLYLGRRLHLLHPVAGRHGHPLAQGAEFRVGLAERRKRLSAPS